MKITRQFKGGNLRRVFRKFLLVNFLISDLLDGVSVSTHSHDGSKIWAPLIPDVACDNETMVDFVVVSLIRNSTDENLASKDQRCVPRGMTPYL